MRGHKRAAKEPVWRTSPSAPIADGGCSAFMSMRNQPTARRPKARLCTNWGWGAGRKFPTSPKTKTRCGFGFERIKVTSLVTRPDLGPYACLGNRRHQQSRRHEPATKLSHRSSPNRASYSFSVDAGSNITESCANTVWRPLPSRPPEARATLSSNIANQPVKTGALRSQGNHRGLARRRKYHQLRFFARPRLRFPRPHDPVYDSHPKNCEHASEARARLG